MNKRSSCFIILLFFFLFKNVLAQDYSTKLGGEYQLLKEVQSVATKVPVVQQMIQLCQQELSAQSSQGSSTQPSMIDQDNKKNECLLNKLKALSPDQQQLLIQAVANLNPNVNDSIGYRSNQSYQSFRNYLHEKVNRELYGDIDQYGQKSKYVDQRTFYQLYKIHLGDAALTYVSWFCVHFDPSTLTVAEDLKRRQEVREENLGRLAQFDKLNSDDKKALQTSSMAGLKSGDVNLGYQHFASCMPLIKHICARTILQLAPNDPLLDFSKDVVFFQGKGNQPNAQKDIDYTRQQACIVIRYLQEIRNSMVYTDKVLTWMDDEKKKQQGLKFNTETYKGAYGTGQFSGEQNLNQLSSLTSKEVTIDSGLQKGMDTQLAKLKMCAENNSPECQQMLYQLPDYQKFQQQVRPAYEAQTAAKMAEIRRMDGVKLKEYLEREGKKEAEIKQIMDRIKDDRELQRIRNEIAERYSLQRAAIIQEMSDKLKKYNLARPQLEQSVVSPQVNQVNQGNVKEVMERITRDVEDKKLQLSSVYHYKNIVSAYITVRDAKGNSSLNTTSASHELGSSAFALPGVPAQHHLDPNYFQVLQQETMKQIGKAKGKENEYSQLQVQELNQVFLDNYLEQRSAPLGGTPAPGSGSLQAPPPQQQSTQPGPLPVTNQAH